MEEFPPGFRFYPTEEELVAFYLRHQLQGNSHALDRVIPVVDIYELEPWHLPKFSGELCHGDTEQWFFFVPRQEREVRGGRPNRTTASGYWKATGSPNYVYSNSNKVIGLKKTMVFYKGKAPSGQKTKWKMNEYRAIEEQVMTSSSSTSTPPAPRLRHEMSVCRVYVISGSCRSFDRRPLGTVITETTVDHDHQQVTGSGDVENAPKFEKASSPETSYSEDKFDHHPHVDGMEIEGSSNTEMTNCVEPLWDLKQFDWN